MLNKGIVSVQETYDLSAVKQEFKASNDARRKIFENWNHELVYDFAATAQKIVTDQLSSHQNKSETSHKFQDLHMNVQTGFEL